MEYAVQVLIVLIVGLVAVVILVGILFNLGGQSANLFTWVTEWVKHLTSLNFGTAKTP